jgi:GNAT superfamily N-acetyltransferase
MTVRDGLLPVRNGSPPMKPANPQPRNTDVSPPGYWIGLARAEDIPALSAIELAAAQMLKGYAPERVLAETTDGRTLAHAARNGRLWVASRGNIPVGFALVEMLAHDLPHLEEIDVAPTHGRRGLGTALVRAVCEWAAVSGYAMLSLTTFRAVPWNLPFYERLGFVEIPRDTMRPELAAVVSEEGDRGLDSDARVVMGYFMPVDPQVISHADSQT